MENFLRHNFANLLKIDPSHIIGVKCHRQIPANIRLPEDTVICEVIFLNTSVSNRNMNDITATFKQHLQTMDFSSWKIFVGSQYVTIQELTHQQLLILIKQLGITLPLQGNLESIAQILKIASQQTANDGKDKHHRSSRKHSRRKPDRDRDRDRDRERDRNHDYKSSPKSPKSKGPPSTTISPKSNHSSKFQQHHDDGYSSFSSSQHPAKYHKSNGKHSQKNGYHRKKQKDDEIYVD